MTSEEKIKVGCGRCGRTNQFPLSARGKTVLCGACRSRLPEPGEVLEPDIEGLSGLLERSGLPLLIDFYSPSCGPCHMMHPILERLAARRAGEIVVVRVNVEREPALAREFGVQAVPTFVVMSKGAERGRTTGAMDESSFALWVASRS